MRAADLLGHLLVGSFRGSAAPAEVLDRVGGDPVGGFALYRPLNELTDPERTRALTDALQSAARAAGYPPLLLMLDQEGGQLMALGGGTPFPGNLALGATRSPNLAREAGYAIGRELAAVGVNVNLAPVCDVDVNPRNPVVGTRSFGEACARVAELAAAVVDGLQAAGVAATAKHFPGHGDTELDSHLGTPILEHDLERLRRVELPPFEAAIRAGARLVMTAHVALPALSDGLVLPATLSERILGQLLRIELGFQGVIISDALDMGAMGRGPERVLDAVAALAAGIDLLLLGPDPSGQEAVSRGVAWALQRGLLQRARVLASVDRVLALKGWIAEQTAATAAAVSVVGCAEHAALAREIAARAITLVRDDARRLPMRPAADARLAVLQPELGDLTPADTSSYVRCRLADALAAFRPVEDLPAYASDPTPAEVAQLVARVADFDLVVVATVNAFAQPGQAALVNALLERHVPTVVVALRMPYDLAMFPAAPTFVCTYSALQPSLAAAAAVLFGECSALGRLPVSIPGLYAAEA